MPQYSPFFEVIHDEQQPVGILGRGTHYSVFQYPSWVTETGSLLSKPKRHRFAIIWDEDHDIRVIRVLEGLYLAGLLTSVVFAGERKGTFTAILSSAIDATRKQELHGAFTGIASSGDDSWPVELFSSGEAGGIISADAEMVQTYLNNLRNIWQLGISVYP